MKALMGSYLEVLPHRYGGVVDRLTWCPREVARSRQETGFLGCRKRCSGSLHSICALSSENQTLVESEEFLTKNTDQAKTAHVRFKLKKECEFGQHFLVVGDDPILGLWDPSEGVPFNWSEGHVWTAELDIPCGKVIKYKFILKEDDKSILWQPGPDRILETWDTEKTVTVFEDWNHPEFQNIVEEGKFISDLKEQSFLNSIVAENISQRVKNEGTDVSKQLTSSKNHANLSQQSMEEEGDKDSNTSESEVPVLVPGMTPAKGSEEEFRNEFKDETVAASLHSLDTNQTGIKKQQEFDDKDRRNFFFRDQIGILGRDMQWGQRTLQKVLAVFRF